MTWTDERLARAALTAAVEPGSATMARRLCETTPEDLWRRILADSGERWHARARGLDVDRLVERSEQAAMRFLIPGDEEWPTSLDTLARVEKSGMGGVPLGLWVVGPAYLADVSRQSVAIVGCRSASSYGQDVATEMAYHLVQGHTDGTGAQTVISGGAYGVDVAAHRGAMSAYGTTVGVLACGLDILYPRGNVAVLEQIAATGLLVSELPPGRHPTRPGFLARNRLIAALSTGTVVVEAGWRSGAINTASWANALGTAVMAVPGPVTSSRSTGTNKLIRDGEAILVRDADDVRGIVGELAPEPERPAGRSLPTDVLNATELAVHEALPARGSYGLDELAASAGVSITQCSAALTVLEQLGMAACCLDGTWSVTLGGDRT
ncbi:DNA-protecting protein DprA [Cutibacterium sp. WCA-380-WT-3A]|uniref:DNA-protecting protein DprA n=1 Tax=Cutibacterium porci TaxID=2605781 RepID=A0A7K0J903_9ACTN|nr:DNA-processing protein DprA [Cutibacterium porci]MSS46431.1 DNA-protecting protein DprA [Cutibacterium porci]